MSAVGRKHASSRVVTEEPGLWCRRGDPPAMESMHRHNDIEINVVLRGELHYLFAGRHLVVREGQIAVFWAAQPHGLIDSRPGDVCWVHVPMATVMSWRLPEAEITALARMEPLVIEAGVIGQRLESMVSLWLEEYQAPETAGITLLEIQAAVRRIVRAAQSEGAGGDHGPGSGAALDGADGSAQDPRPLSRTVPPDRGRHVMAMAQFVVEGFRQEITVADIADAAHLTPSHAMTIFRRTVGVTLGEYLTMCRVAEAQRLLLTTSMTSADIAGASGFGSLSSYYAHLTVACGMTPSRYRRQGH